MSATETVGDTMGANESVGDTVGPRETVGINLGANESVGDTLGANESVGDPVVGNVDTVGDAVHVQNPLQPPLQIDFLVQYLPESVHSCSDLIEQSQHP